MYYKPSTTSTQQNENMAAIGSRPIRAHHSSHVHASFLHGIELCCILHKKLVLEKSCTRNHVRRSSFLYKSTCTSFLTVYHHHNNIAIIVSAMVNDNVSGAVIVAQSLREFTCLSDKCRTAVGSQQPMDQANRLKPQICLDWQLQYCIHHRHLTLLGQLLESHLATDPGSRLTFSRSTTD